MLTKEEAIRRALAAAPPLTRDQIEQFQRLMGPITTSNGLASDSEKLNPKTPE